MPAAFLESSRLYYLMLIPVSWVALRVNCIFLDAPAYACRRQATPYLRLTIPLHNSHHSSSSSFCGAISSTSPRVRLQIILLAGLL